MLLDEIHEETYDSDNEWRLEAYNALLVFMSEVGESEFTTDDFHRWAQYYYNLEDPELNISWGHVFQKAWKRKIIRPMAGKARSGSAQRWVIV